MNQHVMITRKSSSRRGFYKGQLTESYISDMDRTTKAPRAKYTHRRQRSDETCNIQTKVRSMTLSSLGLPPQLRHGHHLRNSRRHKVGFWLGCLLGHRMACIVGSNYQFACTTHSSKLTLDHRPEILALGQ